MSFFIFFTFRLALSKSEGFYLLQSFSNALKWRDRCTNFNFITYYAFFIPLNTQKRTDLFFLWFLFLFSLNFFVQILSLAFQLLIQAQVHFLLLLLPLFLVHFRCVILLYTVFFCYYFFFFYFFFNCLFSLKMFWYSVFVKFKSLTYSLIVLSFVCNDN